MDDAVDFEIREGFRDLARYRDQIKRADNAESHAELSVLIRDTEARLAEIRRRAYRAFIDG